MKAVRAGVQHVIFIIKENRTYDQVLGDLKDGNGHPVGNGKPALTQWGQSITPNQHQLALNFVTLDNFMATSEVSYDGWSWTTSARAPDPIERQYPISYAFRALSLDSEGLNRSVNVAYPTVAERQVGDPLTPNDPALLPGQTDAGAPDGPNNEVNTGCLWDAALRANLTVRNYGFFVDVTCYNEPTCQIPLARAKADARREVLGAGHEGNRFHGRRPRRFRALQPHSLERADGQPAVSRRADRSGPTPEPREEQRPCKDIGGGRS